MSEQTRHSIRLVVTIMALMGLLALAACVPAKPSGGRRAASTTDVSSSDDSSSNSNTPTFSEDEELIYWYSDGQKITGTINLNADSQDVVYLRGKSIHNIAKQETDDDHCLVVEFNQSGMKQLRARAARISFNNFTTGELEHLFRIDLPEDSTNQTHCPNDFNQVSSSDAAFQLSDICPTCTLKVNSSLVSIYATSGTGFAKVPEVNLDTTGLGMRVDMSSNSSTVISECTNSSCLAKGYDCCLSGQCVNDGAVKPNASSENNYTQAVTDVASDPNSFIHYPNVYFVCGHQVTPEPEDPTPVNPEEEANERLARRIKDYVCLTDAAATTPAYTSCEPDHDSIESHTHTSTCFEAVRKRVWIECGCKKSPTPSDPDNYYCPDYGLKAFDSKDELLATDASSGLIAKIECDIPPVDADPTPFQELNVSIPGNTAPHRFFSSTSGTAVDDLTTIYNQDIDPEGAEFYYLDPDARLDPINGDYNINHILGQFSTTLTKALPAKTIDIEFNQTYIISTTAGYYTPCPSCATDSWYDNFSPFPVSNMGVGLQSIGFTTKRDSYNSNTTRGNYEDTIFGRACFVPPTMLPFSHVASGTVATQRAARLETQAALYVNGYQRDWYGFNLGALIGSFDGVTWFAIGKGRRVTSTSKKLFLAINAPFADLALNSDIVVDIVVDNGDATAANYDYDPNLSPTDARQNQAGSCQQHHMCERDVDCITRLGWEYRCADVSKLRTNWPVFDINGDEKANEELASVNFESIIHGNLPTGSTKRCVYRGAGALCKVDYTTGLIDSGSEATMTCAPNFFCATVEGASFNNELIRTPDRVEIFLFGQDANVLGRPKNYIVLDTGVNNDLLPDAPYFNLGDNGSNLISNLPDAGTAYYQLGICRPGKYLGETANLLGGNYLSQHYPPLFYFPEPTDNGKHTDYINQISACRSETTGDYRVQSCPVINTSGTVESNSDFGNYYLTTSGMVFSYSEFHKQNSCGQESTTDRTDPSASAFASIEAAILEDVTSLLLPTIVRDACLRRAGAVCHTDLDCTPNKLHSGEASFLGKSNFGGSEAEKSYWEESLICGQAETPPTTARDSKYEEFDMSLNRCCRAKGESLTLYTEADNTTIIPDLGDDNVSLITSQLSYNGTDQNNRYSRYSIVDLSTGNPSGAPVAQQPKITSGATPYPYQWKAFNDTARRTCCGGGFVRQFSDGGHDWTNLQRLTFDTSKFKCLNYESILTMIDATDSLDILNVKLANYANDTDKFCLSPADGNPPYDGGCSQVQIVPPNGSEIIYPQDIALTSGTTALDRGKLKTAPDPDADGSDMVRQVGRLTPYMPTPYIPDESQVGLNWSEDSYLINGTGYNMGFYLPAYIGGLDNIDLGTMEVKYYKNGALIRTVPLASGGGACNTTGNNVGTHQYCTGSANNRDFITVAAELITDAAGATYWTTAGIEVDFRVMNMPTYVWGTAPADTPDESDGMVAGNALYYLTKLGRLELTGIPQIFYEPLYCNAARDKLVDGIFDVDPDRTSLEGAAFQYTTANNLGLSLADIYNSDGTTGTDASNSSRYITFQDKLSLPQVFSGHKVQCCLSLGMVTDSSADCCSNFSLEVEEQDGDTTVSNRYCKLPAGADVHVYMNRFVSGDGVGTDQPGGGLTDADFIPATGEPKITNEVDVKMASLAAEYCEGGDYRRGGAFGYFYAEPHNGFYLQNGDQEDSRYYSIVDSILDQEGSDAKANGYVRFHEGFRWNHHFYCL
jgi:hypothetical protein